MKQLTDEQIITIMRDCHDGVMYPQDSVWGPRAMKLNEGRNLIDEFCKINNFTEAKPTQGWIGLTYDERWAILKLNLSAFESALVIEDKLREKNRIVS